MKRFNFKKLKEVKGNEQYCTDVSKRFAALGDLDTEVEINSAWEIENITISAIESLDYFELKKHLSSHQLLTEVTIGIHKTIILPVVL
jgi:hypothetical protein